VGASDEPAPPNLVYVFADQLRYGSCGFAGDAQARTPRIDGFAAEGVNFSNAVACTPVCTAYRATLFTGPVHDQPWHGHQRVAHSTPASAVLGTC
jgi:arylsulfatase A-like enzyme